MSKYRLHHNGTFVADYDTLWEAQREAVSRLESTKDINGHISITDGLGRPVQGESTLKGLEVAAALRCLDKADRAVLDLLDRLAASRHCFDWQTARELSEINRRLDSIRGRVIAVKGE